MSNPNLKSRGCKYCGAFGTNFHEKCCPLYYKTHMVLTPEEKANLARRRRLDAEKELRAIEKDFNLEWD